MICHHARFCQRTREPIPPLQKNAKGRRSSPQQLKYVTRIVGPSGCTQNASDVLAALLMQSCSSHLRYRLYSHIMPALQCAAFLGDGIASEGRQNHLRTGATAAAIVRSIFASYGDQPLASTMARSWAWWRAETRDQLCGNDVRWRDVP